MVAERTRPTGSEPEFDDARFTVSQEQDGLRLDAAVAAWTGLSRSCLLYTSDAADDCGRV